MGLLDSLFGSSNPTPASPPTSGGPMLPNYNDFQNNYRTSQILEGFHNGLFSGLAQLFGGATNSAPAAYMNMAMPVYRAQVSQAALNDQPIPPFPFGATQFAQAPSPATAQPASGAMSQNAAPDAQGGATPPPSLASAGPSLLGSSAPMSDASGSSGLLGGSATMPAGAPNAGFGSSLFPPGLLKKAYAAEFLMPGAGKTVLEKNMPGPTPYQQAVNYASSLPEGPAKQQAMFAAAKIAGFDPTLTPRPGQPIFGLDPRANTYGILAPNPKAPDNMMVGPDGVSVIPIPGAYQGARINAGIEQGARVAAEDAIAGNKYKLETGENPPVGANGFGGVPTTVGGMSVGGGARIPPVTTIPNSSAAGAVARGAPITTDKGTVVPVPKGNQVMGPGQTQITNQLADSSKTESNWNAIRPTIETSRQRLGALADAFSQIETKGLTEGKAEISNTLRGAGMPWLADQVMGAPQTADVQKALWNGMQDVLASLKTINAGTGGKILNSEFNAFLEHGFSPNMLGPALHNAVTQQLGTTYQVGNMIDDYYGNARQSGWRDANQYQSAYLRANPIENFVDYAKKTVPPFGGMKGGPGSTAAPAVTPDNQAKAEQLRKNYQMLSKDEQTKQRGTFVKQLQDLGYQ